jgi:hypothetical protein
MRYIVEQDKNDNGALFKVIDTKSNEQVGTDYFSRTIANNRADELNHFKNQE